VRPPLAGVIRTPSLRITAQRRQDGRPDEAVKFADIGATTSAFNLDGGKYGVTVKASTYGTVTLQILAQDGVSYEPAMTAFSSDGYATADLPPGQYKVAIA
jgi:hypothetical protein